MTNLFLLILNMSISASYVALVVIATRFLFKRSAKIFSYFLWLVVAIRLLIPVSFTSSFSLFRWAQPQNIADTGIMEFVPQDIGLLEHPVVSTGIREISRFVNSSLPAAEPIASANPMQIIVWIGCGIWLTGAVILFLYSVTVYLKFVARVRTATLVKDNIFETDQITTPCVCGFLKPKIYIPIGMREHELAYILLHEQTHIRRRDYLIKPFAFLLLIVHWFNPIMWLSYVLMNKDMEMSCDERVVRKMGNQIKESYSTTLLSLSVSTSGLMNGSPLAFGEGNVKARIKNILSYRKPSSLFVAGSILFIAALVVGCSANPKPLEQSWQSSSQLYYSGYSVDKLMENKTLYVGNASKVGGLINGMPQPTGLEWNGMALQTVAMPYGVTINGILNNSTVAIKEGTIDSRALYRNNSILLLALIDNVGSITYSIDDHTDQNDAAYSFTFSREQADQLLGEDVRHYAKDEASLRQLIDHLNAVTFDETK